MKTRTLPNWLSGFLIGSGIGAAVAMLTAPRSGEDTRELIREKGIEIKENAAQTVEDSRQRVAELATDARERLSKLRVVGAGVAQEQKALIEKGAKQARRAVEDKEPIPA